jgi:cytochrome c-type biogenesis protein CcmH
MALFLVSAIFVSLAACAAAFVTLPIFREKRQSFSMRVVLAGAVASAVLGIGAGFYLVVGQPAFALRWVESPEQQNIGGLIALLVRRVHEQPNDLTSWIWLGRAYETANDAGDAAKALARAVAIAQAHRALSPALLTAYGEALVRSANGEVTPEAESAFKSVLAADPKDAAARYFLGFAHAARGENKEAIALWQSLLADMPKNTALAHDLSDRVAALTSKTGAAPDVGRMVEGLAERLQVQPNDPEGWQRLVRAWSVLGDRAKAQAALDRARAVLVAQPGALVALNAEARELKLR